MDERSEAQRLDHVAGLVFEGSIALAAGAAAIAFTQEASVRTAAFLVAVGAATPGFAAGWLAIWDPLRSDLQDKRVDALELKRRAVNGAMALFLLGVPLFGLLIAGVLFFPDVVSRVIALAGLVLGTFAPAAAYLASHRVRLPGLLQRRLSDLQRLDPDVDDVEMAVRKYGPALAAAAGVTWDGRLLRRAWFALVAATAMFGIGWAIVLAPAWSGDELSLAAWAFLGAYLTVLQTALGGSLLSDLKATSFEPAALSVAVALAAGAILELTIHTSSAVVDVAVFALGLLIGVIARRRPSLRLGARDAGLETLDGLDWYDRRRLLEVGISDLTTLVSVEPAVVYLQTGVPPARLVDWIDQALLRIYVGDADRVGEMRQYGIRTATDLLLAGDAMVEATPSGSGLRQLLGEIAKDPRVAWLLRWHQRDAS